MMLAMVMPTFYGEIRMRNPTIKHVPHYQELLELLAACIRASKDIPPDLREQVINVLQDTEPEYLTAELKCLKSVVARV
jgi:hypothetical protein